MTVLVVELGFALQCCPHCNAAFMLLTIDLEARAANGRSHFCPNGHEIHSSAKSELAQARWQRDTALSAWEEETGDLKAEVAKLELLLDAMKVRAGKLEATIAELQQKPEPETPTVLAYGSGAAPITLEFLADMATVIDRDQEFVPAPPDLPPIGAYADDDPEAHASASVVKTWRDEAEPKTCGHRGCENTFLPKPNVAEAIWKKQKFCSHKCAVRENGLLAKERREQQAAAPTLTDPQYGGPEAPPEAVEQVTEQVTEPRSSEGPNPTQLEPAGLKPAGSELGPVAGGVATEEPPAELLPIEQSAEPEPVPEWTNTPPTVETSPPEEVVPDAKKLKGGLAPRALAKTSPSEIIVADPRPFMDASFMTKDKVLCLLSLERAETGCEPTGEKVEVDDALLDALFEALECHDEAFLEVFRQERPGLVKMFEQWQGTHPALRKRALAP